MRRGAGARVPTILALPSLLGVELVVVPTLARRARQRRHLFFTYAVVDDLLF